MTAAFADSSAIVKLYADEAGASAVRDLNVIVVSQLARIEVPAAVWRKSRMGELGPADAATLVAEFEADFFGTADEQPRFAVVSVTSGILEAAARLVAAHPLRSYDAVQLASADAAKSAAGEALTFAAFDKALNAAAAATGLDLLQPGKPRHA